MTLARRPRGRPPKSPEGTADQGIAVRLTRAAKARFLRLLRDVNLERSEQRESAWNQAELVEGLVRMREEFPIRLKPSRQETLLLAEMAKQDDVTHLELALKFLQRAISEEAEKRNIVVAYEDDELRRPVVVERPYDYDGAVEATPPKATATTSPSRKATRPTRKSGQPVKKTQRRKA